MIDEAYVPEENVGGTILEDQWPESLQDGPTLEGDLNRARKNYWKYATTSHYVLFNVPLAKQVKSKQVPIMWIEDG